MKNKLDAFNKDKTKCEKCKEYFDEKVSSKIYQAIGPRGRRRKLCAYCAKKWHKYYTIHIESPASIPEIYEEFINEKQT